MHSRTFEFVNFEIASTLSENFVELLNVEISTYKKYGLLEWTRHEKGGSSAGTRKNLNCKLIEMPANKNFWFYRILFCLEAADARNVRAFILSFFFSFFFSYGELFARTCLCSFRFIFDSLQRFRVESCIFCAVLAAGIRATCVFPLFSLFLSRGLP